MFLSLNENIFFSKNKLIKEAFLVIYKRKKNKKEGSTRARHVSSLGLVLNGLCRHI
jgi:hypothetical protein